MTKKKRLLISLGVVLGILLVAGITAAAVTNYGSQSDPLVTLSYLDETYKGEVLSSLDESIAAKEEELKTQFDGQVEQYTQDIQEKMDASGSATASSQMFKVITLKKNQTVTCAPGTEIMLRVGSAVSAGGSSPRLVNTTGGSTVNSAGTNLVKNNMYMVTIQNNGIKATAEGTMLLIRGTYTIS